MLLWLDQQDQTQGVTAVKSEAEIRAHRDNLRHVRDNPLPCNCATNGHAMECRVGGMLMTAEVLALSWVLGEADEHQEAVEFFAGRAQ